jgi:hypothetical protein
MNKEVEQGGEGQEKRKDERAEGRKVIRGAEGEEEGEN